jgi:hypothetical protein
VKQEWKPERSKYEDEDRKLDIYNWAEILRSLPTKWVFVKASHGRHQAEITEEKAVERSILKGITLRTST